MSHAHTCMHRKIREESFGYRGGGVAAELEVGAGIQAPSLIAQ